VSDTDRLRRGYRLLMWAYPRWYRRERGPELVTTLLDDAAPGQRRPRLAEALDILRGGLLARLRVPRDVVSYMAALVAVLWFGLAGAAVGVRLSPYPGPPAEEQAIAVAMVAVPQVPRNIPGPVIHCDLDCSNRDSRDDVVAYDNSPDHTDQVVVSYHPPAAQVPEMAETARQRLDAAGWRVSQVFQGNDGYVTLYASNGELNVYLDGSTGQSPDSGVYLNVQVSKGFSATASQALVGGLAGGMLVGWPLMAWVLQRRRRHHAVLQRVIEVLGGPFLIVASINLAGAGVLFGVTTGAGFAPKDVQIPEFVLSMVPGVFPPGAVALAVWTVFAFVFAGLPTDRRRPPAQPARPPAPPARPPAPPARPLAGAAEVRSGRSA
jgi:hypothetical protein